MPAPSTAIFSAWRKYPSRPILLLAVVSSLPPATGRFTSGSRTTSARREKAHPALRVEDLDTVPKRASPRAAIAPYDDEPLPGYRRFYVADPFGNRLELIEPAEATVAFEPTAVQREAARTLARLGGSQPHLKPIPRRRPTLMISCGGASNKIYPRLGILPDNARHSRPQGVALARRRLRGAGSGVPSGGFARLRRDAPVGTAVTTDAAAFRLNGLAGAGR